MVLTLDSSDNLFGAPKPSAEPDPFEEARSKLLSLYNAGVPLFTKQAIRDFELVRSNLRNGQETIPVKLLDGNTFDLPLLEVGSVGIAYDTDLKKIPDMEAIHEEPILEYCSLQHLFKGWGPEIFNPLALVYPLSLRRKDTGDIMPYNPCPPLSPLNQVRDHFTAKCEQWEASKECKIVKSSLISANIPPNTCKVIAFALSSISYGQPDEDIPYTLRSFYQHALVLTVRDALLQKAQMGKPTNDNKHFDIECYAQDPVYCEHDKTVLAEAGIKVIPDPEGFLEADESSVVISISPNVPVKQIIADLVKPAVIIWEQVDRNEKIDLYARERHTDPISPRVIAMLRDSYDEVEFPGGLDCFRRLAIYVRRPALAKS
ncbi:hypothetical protein FQN57_000300 [Myotisia sp. PD_48]|nr:hypothetical protein FQN57_000300 [Myotisia sp. PD_48]